jgi:hypothetical protein
MLFLSQEFWIINIFGSTLFALSKTVKRIGCRRSQTWETSINTVRSQFLQKVARKIETVSWKTI